MRLRLLASLLPIIFLPFFSLAGDQPPVRLRESELSHSPLIAGSLKITIKSIKGRGSLSESSYLVVQVENTSTAFTVFSPHRLSLVDGENSQLDVLSIANQASTAAVNRTIAPGAHLRENYELNGKVRLPARLYYDEKLLAVIAD